MVITPGVSLFGIPVFSGGKRELIESFSKHLRAARAPLLRVFTPNPEQLMLAQNDRAFHSVLSRGDVNIPDGSGLIFASRMLHGISGISERIPGREVVEELLFLANEQKYGVFLLGGKGETAPELQRKLENIFPRIRFSSSEGVKNVRDPNPQDTHAALSLIDGAQPRIVFVAFGAPYQEKWIEEHKKALEKSGVRIAMAVGGTFDILLGTIPRAPRSIERLHAEWLWRLMQEPWRWRRQLALPRFVVRVVLEKLSRR